MQPVRVDMMRENILPHLNILGTRGIPASHGGFETFAQRLAEFLVGRGVSVTVYCQSEEGIGSRRWEDYWHGIHRVHFATRRRGPLGTIEFDWACIRDVLNRPGVDLVLGYNTALFCALQRLRGRRIFMNMDGIEWRREKWSIPARLWLMCNEIIGCNVAQVPIADHPEIGRHIASRCRKAPVVIPYGADVITNASDAPVLQLGMQPGRYFISVARIEPDNSILQIVQAFNKADCGQDLLVLGRTDPANPYHREVRAAAGPRVHFPGGIYDSKKLSALRFHARAYLHGHQVGGTNPSLVEALGAGNAVIAHDNAYNRWTAGPGQRYFRNAEECAAHIRALAQDDLAAFRARIAARERHANGLRWQDVLSAYQRLLFGAEAGAAAIPAPQVAAE